MKCERCGNEEVKEYGILMREASGPNATVNLVLETVKGKLVAGVCRPCSEMLRKLGWK